MDTLTELFGSSKKGLSSSSGSNFIQPLVEEIQRKTEPWEADDVIEVHFNGGVVYRFRWSDLQNHPTFSITKWCLKKGRSDLKKVTAYQVDPELAPFVYRLIRYNIKINLETVCGRLGCNLKQALLLVQEYGFNESDTI